MHGIRIHEVEKINGYGYRIDNQEEKISVYDEDTKILEINFFNQEAKLRLSFTEKDEKNSLVKWISIKPKKETKGLLVGYNRDGKLFGEEIIPKECRPSN